MNVLTRKNRELLCKLVRIAGSRRAVNAAIAKACAKHGDKTSLTHVVAEIEAMAAA